MRPLQRETAGTEKWLTKLVKRAEFKPKKTKKQVRWFKNIQVTMNPQEFSTPEPSLSSKKYPYRSVWATADRSGERGWVRLVGGEKYVDCEEPHSKLNGKFAYSITLYSTTLLEIRGINCFDGHYDRVGRDDSHSAALTCTTKPKSLLERWAEEEHCAVDMQGNHCPPDTVLD